jgi:hypothetical protein
VEDIMKKIRDKFLTESMGLCWHDNYKHKGPTFKDRYDKYICNQCGIECAYSPHFPRIDFSTWKGLGKLWEWANEQTWWNQFAGNNIGHWTFDGKKVFVHEYFITPNNFSDALYEWGIVWFESFGIVNHNKGTYDI